MNIDALLITTSYRAARRYAPPPANRGGSTSVRGRIRSPHSSGGLAWRGAARLRQAGQTDGRTDRSRHHLMAPYVGGIIIGRLITLQSGTADIQSPQHLDAFVPATPNQGSRTRPQPAIDHYDAVSTFHDDDFCETRFSMLCTSCLELTTANCSQ